MFDHQQIIEVTRFNIKLHLSNVVYDLICDHVLAHFNVLACQFRSA